MYKAIDATHPVLGILWIIAPHKVSCPTARQIPQVIWKDGE